MSRWMINRFGFVNFWLYDVEDFTLQDGRILLRGANASGKSITTQSVVPFLLDGNRSPERLDPFGSKDRKMDYYLLGEGEKDDSTGYLYLEFKKPDLPQYVTIGIGMRAQKGKNIDFWGFCLNDGRRIDEDVMLYRKIGGQNLPLSRIEMKNVINDEANWANSQGAYKKLVNERVFQFREPEQYDMLISLLLKIRAPKLSKEHFRPAAIIEILNASLQILGDNDLGAMVSAMEKMDSIQTTLANLKEALRNAQIIRNEYNRYNQFVLGQKAKAYLDARGAVEKHKNALRRSDDDLCIQKETLEHKKRQLQNAEALLTKYHSELDALGKGELSEKAERLTRARGEYQQLTDEYQDAEKRIIERSQNLAHNEIELRDKQSQQKEMEYECQRAALSLDKINVILQLPDHKDILSALHSDDLKSYDPRVLLSDYQKRLEKNRDCLRQIDMAEEDWDKASEVQDTALQLTRSTQEDHQAALSLERDARDKLVEDFHIWITGISELCFSKEQTAQIIKIVSGYQSYADYQHLEAIVRINRDTNYNRLIENKSVYVASRDSIQKEIETCERDIEILNSTPEPVPIRSEQLQETRRYLATNNIPYRVFYEAVDFREGVDHERRNLLEAQFSDMGFLDALVVPESYHEAISKLIKKYPDRFILPNTPVLGPITDLIPSVSGELGETVKNILAGISCVDASAPATVFPDGAFVSGQLKGHSKPVCMASFIGAEARKLNKERQLEELCTHFSQLQADYHANEQAISNFDGRISTLEYEVSVMPSIEVINQALLFTRQTLEMFEKAKSEQARISEEAQKIHSRLQKLKHEIRNLSIGLPYEKTTEAYDEALDSIFEYRDACNDLKSLQGRFRIMKGALTDKQNQVEDLRDALGESREEQRRRENKRQAAEVEINVLEEFINRPENQKLAARLEKLNSEVQRLGNEKYDLGKDCAVLEEKIQGHQEKLREQRQRVIESEYLEDILKNYFAEDLALGYTVERAERTLPECAQEAVSQVQARDRERSYVEVNRALDTNFHQHNNSLLEYQPQIELAFDPPKSPEQLRQRCNIMLHIGGKPLSLYGFIKELEQQIENSEAILEESDRNIFENILSDTISDKLRKRIQESRQWCKDMSDLMEALDTSMGLNFSLEWKGRSSTQEGELDTAYLVTLLNKDRKFLAFEDIRKISQHFRTKVHKERRLAEDRGEQVNYSDLIQDALDYRRWFEFHLYFRRTNEQKRELTLSAFNKFSGGEKAMAMYLPQFAALYAQYDKAGEDCPMILAMDEAFAGVDEKNIASMFSLVDLLDLKYIMNSQFLWGCYPTVAKLDIADFTRPANSQIVTILHYYWTGHQKQLLDH